MCVCMCLCEVRHSGERARKWRGKGERAGAEGGEGAERELASGQLNHSRLADTIKAAQAEQALLNSHRCRGVDCFKSRLVP